MATSTPSVVLAGSATAAKAYAKRKKAASKPRTISSTPTPFLTPDEAQAVADRYFQGKTEIDNANQDLMTSGVNAVQQTHDIEEGRRKDISAQADTAIARGLFNSSINQGALNDINAAASIQQSQLSTGLALQAAKAAELRKNLGDQFNNFANNTNQTMIANAAALPTVPDSTETPAQTAARLHAENLDGTAAPAKKKTPTKAKNTAATAAQLYASGQAATTSKPRALNMPGVPALRKSV